MNKHVNDSCKQRAECLRHSLIIVHAECHQWQESSTQKKSAISWNSCNRDAIIYTVFQEFSKINTHAHTVDTRCFFSPPLSTGNQANMHTCMYWLSSNFLHPKDYPSVGQVAALLTQFEVVTIFAVAQDVLLTYQVNYLFVCLCVLFV